MMAALVFTNPALWIGVLAVGAPVAIHLLTRLTSRVIRYPTMRFLMAGRARQSRLYKLRHLILLALRTLFVALVLLAFLKPVIRQRPSAGLPDASGSTATVVILDASLSMSHGGSMTTPFARGRSASDKIFNELAAGSRANLILAGASATASLPDLTENRSVLKRDLHVARPTLERADIDAAIAEAARQLSRAGKLPRELYLVSDFQRDNWAAVNFAAIPRDVTVLFIPVDEANAANVAVTEVLAHPSSPTVGEETDIVCKIGNFGPHPSQLPVRLKLGDNTVLTREVNVPERASASVSFRVRFNVPGVHEVEVILPEDRLVADDRRYTALTVADRVRVTILSDEPVGEVAASHRYLSRALNPFEDPRAGNVAVETMRTDKFDDLVAARSQVVILSGTGAWTPQVAGALLRYLRDGGSAIYFLGNESDRANLGLWTASGDDDVRLPVTLRSMVDRVAAGGSPGVWAQADFDAPLLKPFRDSRDLGTATFRRYFATDRVVGQGDVWLRYDDRNIALARGPVGRGGLLIANFSVAQSSSDLARRTMFVPLLHEMIKVMRPQGGVNRSFTVGQPASMTVAMTSEPRAVRFTDATGESMSATFEPGRDGAIVMFSQTSLPGLYRMYADDVLSGAVAVNVDGRESNLESLSVQQLRERSALEGDRFLAADGADAGELERLREGRSLWAHFLMAAMCVLMVEQLLTGWWRR